MKPSILTSSLLVAAALQAEAVAQSRVIALPDTQFYSQDYPQLFQAQTQWVADRFLPDGIAFVTHLGDIVNEAATLGQWDVATGAMGTLDDADVPYGTCVGNHDLRYPGSYFDVTGTNYRVNFGPQFYTDEPWYRGHSPSELSNYQIITVDGREFLFLHILIETPPEELAWAQGILNEHRDLPTWISTHRYLFSWGPLGSGRYDSFNYFFEPPYVPTGVPADDFFNNFVAANRQVFLVHCGHNDGEYRQVSSNNFGLPVYEILSDYQTTYGNGGNGWLRILDFDTQAGRIDVQTYSPSLNDFRTGGESLFSIDVDFDAYVSGSPVLRFQDGLEGYDGTRDTWVGLADPDTSFGGSSVIIVDDDTTNSAFGEAPGQGLLRFQGMFQGPVFEGDPEPTAIPEGALIERASLSIDLADDTNIGDPVYSLYRMTRPWGESATWNSLDGGIQVGTDTAPELLGTFAGDNNPDFDSTRTIQVTPAVQAWSDGAPQRGFAILPEQIDFNDDGIEIRSREDGSSILRPKLEVEFSYTPINVPPAITQSLAASELRVWQGDEVILSFAAADPNPLDPLVFRINLQDVGFATGEGTIEHPVLFDLPGTFTFQATVADDEDEVAAGQVTIVVEPRDTLDRSEGLPGPVLGG